MFLGLPRTRMCLRQPIGKECFASDVCYAPMISHRENTLRILASVMVVCVMHQTQDIEKVCYVCKTA